jgi:uncharacterized protein (DUF362 family)
MATVLIEDAFDIAAQTAAALETLESSPSIKRGTRVFLKPNLTYPRHKPGVTTSPRFIREVLRTFHELGAIVTIGDGDGGYGAWSADLAFEGHGLTTLCRQFGAKLVNLSTTSTRLTEIELGGKLYRERLPIVLLDETDVFVTMPVPKIHAMTVYSGAVKNQWGCIPDRMRLRRHPDFVTLVWAVNTALRPQLVLGDGEYILNRTGPLVGDPVYMNRFIASNDILAFDVAVAEQLMGLSAEEIPYLRVGRDLTEYKWHASSMHDRSTGTRSTFFLRRSMRHRVTAAAFPKQWAVNLLWFSPIGKLAHSLLYAMSGNPIAEERMAIEASRGSSVETQ